METWQRSWSGLKYHLRYDQGPDWGPAYCGVDLPPTWIEPYVTDPGAKGCISCLLRVDRRDGTDRVELAREHWGDAKAFKRERQATWSIRRET